MSTEIVGPLESAGDRAGRRPPLRRALAIEFLGPLTMLGGIVWAILQPYRIVFFDRAGKGLYDYLIQPPLLVDLRRRALHVRDRTRTARGPPLRAMTPRAELVHWAFAAGFLLLGLILLAEAIVGSEVFAMRRWRLYLWPSLAFAIGVLLWPVAVFFTNSTLHMLAHASWAEMAMLAGAVQLALVRGKLAEPLVDAGRRRSRWSSAAPPS